MLNLNLTNDLIKVKEIVDNYRSNSFPNDENKYSQLNNELNPYFTPFETIDVENNKDILIEKFTGCDINVIVDNLEDMYSTTFSKVGVENRRRFAMSKYNLGLTKLDTIESTSSKLITTRVKMTEPDLMSIKSFVTLPEPAIRFSKINLPNSALLEKANLNMAFLNYWQLLTKNTRLNNVLIDNIDNDIEYNEDDFVNNIKNYILNLMPKQKRGLTTTDIYSQFIQTIIPKTKILFNLMKKHMSGKLSIVAVVSYLVPFLIYPDNLTYMQYVDIVTFIDGAISLHNKNFIDRAQSMHQLKYIKKNPINFENVYNIISMLKQANVRKEVFDKYDITIDNQNMMVSNNEILCKFIRKDANRLYTSALSLQNIPLTFPSQFTSLFDDEKQAIATRIKNAEEKEGCKNHIVAKKYSSIEELNLDNNKDIYFDKMYDKTNYALLDQYENQLLKMTPDNFIVFLSGELKKKQNLDAAASEYLTTTLLNGNKTVIDGQYAILSIVGKQDMLSEYYVRHNNKWVLDNNYPVKDFIDDTDVLCNLQQKCMSYPTKFDNKCESLQLGELNVHEELIDKVINEFDNNYNVSKEMLIKTLQSSYETNLYKIEKLTQIQTYNLLKDNNFKYKLGSSDDDTSSKIISPYSQLLNLILKQSDFVKKQQDIVRFVNTYTRTAVTNGLGPLNQPETEYWLYCIKSNVPILPIFRFNMATTYITNPLGYNNYVDILISKIGKLSDDGNLWSDEHSGWTIQKIEDDFDEGYDNGFKVSTRSIMEDDIGNKITLVNNKIIYDTLESKTISNITNAISIAMGINIEGQKEFIINGVLDSLKSTLEPEDDYKKKVKEMAEKNKKIVSYNDFYNTAILFYTLGMILIAIQTSIPSVKTRKTHPGCIRSFKGYPFEGAGDNSSLEYLACVVYDIRTSAEPWYVLQKKKQDYISTKIKAIIDTVLLNLQNVKIKFEQKTEYLLLNNHEAIPEEHSVSNWINFLPPLVPFKIKNLTNISSDFKKSLMNELKSGIETQEFKLQVVRSKIMLFSLAIQEQIQSVVRKEALLLVKGNNEPYLENACCETNDKTSTITYFTNKNKDILEYNNVVLNLTNLLEDVTSFTKSQLLYSNINTKNKYPEITNEFDTKIIYLSFIHFCKFKSTMVIPEYLLPLCNDKPDITLINANDSTEEIIIKLKQEGRNYNYETFLRLLQVVSKHNIINTTFNAAPSSSMTKMTGLIEAINNENDKYIDKSLIKLLLDLLDTFDIASKEVSKEAKALNNYLIKENDEMKEDIIEFLKKNKGGVSTNKLNKAINCITNLDNWESGFTTTTSISNDNMYNSINFYKTHIANFTKTFPNIILNKVDYQHTVVPNYLGLSSTHASKIKTLISDYYKSLQILYGVNELNNLLNVIPDVCKNIVNLSQITPALSSIKNANMELIPIFDDRTSKLLYEYYLFKNMMSYVGLTDDADMIVHETQHVYTEEVLVTEEYLEDRTAKVDFMDQRKYTDTHLLSGNKKLLKQYTANMLIVYIDILCKHKETINISYDTILDRVFKLKEKEKDMVTDRLKFLTDEERDADTILKINKLGVWGKGMQKGLTQYVKETYDDEREFREKMDDVERKIRSQHKNITDNELGDETEDYLQEEATNAAIEKEEYDMTTMRDDYDEGNFIDYEADSDGDYN